MIEKLLSVGGKIELRRYRNSIGTNVSDEKIYISQLFDIKEETKISIAMPVEAGKLIVLEVGETYYMYFYTPAGLYHCIGRVESRYHAGQLPVADIVFLSEMEKYQRRQFFRLNCILDMTYQTPDGEDQAKTGLIIDISGGGARFNSSEQYEPGEQLMMYFELPVAGQRKQMGIQARVISSERLVNKEKTFENRVEFFDIESNTRETIVKYVFEQERKRRKRESGML